MGTLYWLIMWRYRIGSTPVLQYFGAFCSICESFPLGSVPSEAQYIFFNVCFRSFLQLTVAAPVGAGLRGTAAGVWALAAAGRQPKKKNPSAFL